MKADIFTEPANLDPDTLRNLGPLAALAGVWQGEGADRHPVAEGGETQNYEERMVLEPIAVLASGSPSTIRWVTGSGSRRRARYSRQLQFRADRSPSPAGGRSAMRGPSP